MLEKDIYPLIASELKAQPHQVEAAAKLLDEGNTVPFMRATARRRRGRSRTSSCESSKSASPTCAASSSARKKSLPRLRSRAS